MRGSWAVGVAVVALSFVAGCSSGSSSAVSGKPPREILKTAGMAMARASSVKITGTVTGILEDRTVQDRVRYVVFSNGDLAGTISDPGGRADIVYIVPRVAPGTAYAIANYYRGNADFYVRQQAAPSVARKISGVWIIASGIDIASGTASLFALTDLTDLLLHPAGSLRTGPPERIDGQAVVPVHESTVVQVAPSTTTSLPGTSSTPSTIVTRDTFWIADSGTPYPVAMSLGNQLTGPAMLAFSNWNGGTPPLAPAGASPISEFTGRPGNTWFEPIKGKLGGTAGALNPTSGSP
jgi:hypothetical protein